MKIETFEYVWECGDGCCTEHDTILFIDGMEVEYRFASEAAAYQYVLTDILGHEVGFIEGNKDDET